MLAVVAAALLSAGSFDPAVAFGRLPLLEDIQVSPSGKRFAATYANGGQTGLAIYELTNSGIQNRLISESENLKVSDFFWKRDDRLVFSARVPSERYGFELIETRLLAITPGEPGIDPLFETPVSTPRRGAVEYPVQIQDDIVSRLPKDPKHILVQYRRNGGDETLYRINVDRLGRHKVAENPEQGSSYFVTDVNGVARARGGLLNNRRKLSLKLPDGSWKDYSHRVEDEEMRFGVIGFPSDPERAFVLSEHETPTRALYVFNVVEDAFEEQLFTHPVSDVMGVYQRLSDGAAYGAYFAEDNHKIHFFEDNTISELGEFVEEKLGTDDISFAGLNPQETMGLYYVAKDNQPGRYYFVDIENLKLTQLPLIYPELEGVTLGRVIETSYEARDGLTIPAFVTLPPGISSLEGARDLPFMVLPHGGPEARDYSVFDWLAQYVAHQGYGVLQMNFRGSYGYGSEFRDAGRGEWGQAMQDDITDGSRWLIENGYADPDRLAIMGASYGGYAALMGAVKTPDLFTCAIAINGVSNLLELIDDQGNFVGGTYRTRHIGRLWKDRSMLAENSPALRADDISVPVLLIASEEDRVVPPEHSIRMHRAIRRTGGSSQLVELPLGSHSLDVGDNRIEALRTIGEFMNTCKRR